MSRTKIMRASLAAAPIIILSAVSLFTSNDSVIAESWNRPMLLGVVRAGAGQCDDRPGGCFCVVVGSTCLAPPVVLQATLLSAGEGAPPFAFVVTGPDGRAVHLLSSNPFSGEMSFRATKIGTYTVTVIDANGCIGTGEGGILPCLSLTQDQYADSTNIPALSEFDNYVFVGIPGLGSRSVSFFEGTESCISQRLPASGRIEALPLGLGDVVMDPTTCQTSPPLITDAHGKFTNALLGQQIALSLNVLADGKLESVPLCPTMITQRVLRGPVGNSRLDAGPDGVLGTKDDPVQIIRIPRSVFNALSEFNLPATIGGLIQLGDFGLFFGGQTINGASLRDINEAIGAMNLGFNSGRILTRCIDQ
jgi:hypothetical protein